MDQSIGGYLELDHQEVYPFHSAALSLNTARNALRYVIELRDIRTIWLPDYLCSAVFDACEKEGVTVRVYSIGTDLRPSAFPCVGSEEWLYIVDYFGQLTEGEVLRAMDLCGGRLIVDEAQGFFVAPWSGADTIYTCRKFFGVPDGAYLVVKDGTRLKRPLDTDRSHLRMTHVLGRLEEGSEPYYLDYAENEELLDELSVMEMSKLTAALLSNVDYQAARESRERNWAQLSEGLDAVNVLDLQAPVGPFMYPLLIEGVDGAGLRSRLQKDRIYVPCLWPNVLEGDSQSAAYHLAKDLLPLPIDQRYGASEMACMMDAIKKYANV